MNSITVFIELLLFFLVCFCCVLLPHVFIKTTDELSLPTKAIIKVMIESIMSYSCCRPPTRRSAAMTISPIHVWKQCKVFMLSTGTLSIAFPQIWILGDEAWLAVQSFIRFALSKWRVEQSITAVIHSLMVCWVNQNRALSHAQLVSCDVLDINVQGMVCKDITCRKGLESTESKKTMSRIVVRALAFLATWNSWESNGRLSQKAQHDVTRKSWLNL